MRRLGANARVSVPTKNRNPFTLRLSYRELISQNKLLEMKLLILSPYVSNRSFKFQRNRPILEYVMILGQQITGKFGHCVTR